MLTVRVAIALCKAEVNDVHCVLRQVTASDQEVVWLDVPVDDALLMDLLNALDLDGMS